MITIKGVKGKLLSLSFKKSIINNQTIHAMRTFKIFTLVLIANTAFYSCKDQDVQQIKPVDVKTDFVSVEGTYTFTANRSTDLTEPNNPQFKMILQGEGATDKFGHSSIIMHYYQDIYAKNALELIDAGSIRFTLINESGDEIFGENDSNYFIVSHLTTMEKDNNIVKVNVRILDGTGNLVGAKGSFTLLLEQMDNNTYKATLKGAVSIKEPAS